MTTKQSKDHTSSYGKKIHRPKKIKPLRREAPAFKERKVVKSKRNKHPFLMERKARGEIEGFKLTSHPNNSPKVVKLRDFPKSKRKETYAYAKRIRATPDSLWLPDDYRQLKVSKRDFKRVKKKTNK